MNIQRILVVCVGNICRSPLAAHLLETGLPGKEVRSAGLKAVIGSDMEAVARAIATERGHRVPLHRAQQLTTELCLWAELILVMEVRHRDAITRLHPAARGKIFLLAHGMTNDQIEDPYRLSEGVHEAAQIQIEQACFNWIARLH